MTLLQWTRFVANELSSKGYAPFIGEEIPLPLIPRHSDNVPDLNKLPISVFTASRIVTRHGTLYLPIPSPTLKLTKREREVIVGYYKSCRGGK